MDVPAENSLEKYNTEDKEDNVIERSNKESAVVSQVFTDSFRKELDKSFVNPIPAYGSEPFAFISNM